MSAPDVEARITAARVRKAGALGIDVALIDGPGRRAAEALAGVPPSSDATWAMVADMLSARAAVRARFGEAS